MRILLIGDIFGEYGRKAIEDNLPKLIQEYGINFPTSITTSALEKSFVQEDNETEALFKNALNQNVTLVDSENTQYVYIILDYVEEAIEDIYSKNIGNDALNGISEYEGDYITYACDFTISLDKV